MSDLIVSLIMVGLSLWFAKGASDAVTGFGFLTQSVFAGIFLVLAIPVAIGFSWPFIVIGALAMIITFTASIILWKMENTKLSLVYLLLAMGNGIILGVQLSI